MKPKGRILVIRGGAIGDFIVTLPVLTALRHHFPGTHIEVLGYPRIAQLALAGGLADAVRSIESREFAGFFSRGGPLDQGLEDYFASFSLILSYLYDPDLFFEQNVKRHTAAHFIAGPHRPDEAQQVHASDVFLKPLERLAIFGADPVPRIDLSPMPLRPASLRTVAAHPGSGSERKNWPEDRWMGFLAGLLRREPVRLVLVGGEAEAGRLQRLAAGLAPDRVELVESRPLAELAVRLHECAAFIGHDSGITHLAAALGLPGAVLWGPSNPAIWRPLSARMTLIQAPAGLAGIEVNHVLDRVAGLLHRASAAARGTTGPACANETPVDCFRISRSETPDREQL